MNKNIITSVLLATSLLTANVALAETAPGWDLVQISYASLEIDEADELDFTGFNLSGSKLINENVFVLASYTALSDSYEGVDLNVDTYAIGVGYRYGLNNTTDIYGSVSFQGAELKASGNGESDSIDDTGYGLAVGIRSMVTDQVELSAAISYVSIDSESDTAFSAAAFYNINDQFSVGAGFSTSSDASGYNLTARYSF